MPLYSYHSIEWVLTRIILICDGGRPSLVVYKFKYSRIATLANGIPVIAGWLPYSDEIDE
mgnify:CR=1 FL=1